MAEEGEDRPVGNKLISSVKDVLLHSWCEGRPVVGCGYLPGGEQADLVCERWEEPDHASEDDDAESLQQLVDG